MKRFRPTVVELGVAIGSAALALGYTQSQAAGSATVAGGFLVAVTVLGVVTAADNPDREGLIRAAVWCTAGVAVGSLPVGFFRASLLVLVFALGRWGRMLQIERKTSEQRTAAAVAQERAQMARDLHDVIAHSLGVVIVQVQAAERVMDGDPDRARAALRSAAAIGRDALDDMHRMVGVMRAGAGRPEAQPSLADLPELIRQARETGARVELQMAPQPTDGSELPPGLQVAAYRIVQEALTNAARHASGAAVSVKVDRRADGLTVEVSDSGGHARPVAGGGFGIAGMRERAALYGGTVEAGPGPDGGFVVTARLPSRPA